MDRNPASGGGGEQRCMLGRVRSLSDMVLGFFEEGEALPESCWVEEEEDGGSEEESGSSDGSAERKAFWESQHQVLQASLSKNSALESRIRRDTENVLRQLRSSDEAVCSCSKSAVKECRNCTLRAVSDRLRAAGHDSALCKSKWRSSDDIPSGEHNYLDVLHKSKKGPVRVVIEHNFRAEFEMARASKDYNSLVSRLPEVFVGKPEKLQAVIKVVCAAAKKCMKDNKMHMAPWRKHKYMQAKWLSPSSQRAIREPIMPATVVVEERTFRRPQPMASMLTFDMLEKISGLHCTAVEVV